MKKKRGAGFPRLSFHESRGVRRILVTAGVIAAGLSMTACGGEPTTAEQAAAHPLSQHSADFNIDAIPDRPPEGRLAGEAFRTEDARTRIERFPGRERIDLWLAETQFEHCGLMGRDSGRRVYIRIPGTNDLPEEPLRIDPDMEDPPMSVNYDVPDGRQWRGVARAAAVLQIDSADAEAVVGRIQACFDDGQGSCISGRFRAVPCRSPVDGTLLRELPADVVRPPHQATEEGEGADEEMGEPAGEEGAAEQPAEGDSAGEEGAAEEPEGAAAEPAEEPAAEPPAARPRRPAKTTRRRERSDG